jgi:two-component system response regulator AdeR
VDDDKECLEELQETLVSVGYEVEAINDSLLVLEAANRANPDCILLDLKMPKKSGFRVADELRQLKHIPVIAITAFFTETEHSLLMKICGIRKCLKKPLNPVEVIEQIEIVLSNKPNKK